MAMADNTLLKYFFSEGRGERLIKLGDSSYAAKCI